MVNIENLQIIPTPKHVKCLGTRSFYKAEISAPHQAFQDAAEVFVTYADKMGMRFGWSETGAIAIRYDAELGAGAYRLLADGRTVKLFAADSAGANHAFATLLQIMEGCEEPAGNVTIPDCEIADAPDCSYRGMMVDLARNWHEFPYLIRYVDQCYFYKLSVLHLHFTDDQSYTLPSKLFPKLSTEGRCYTEEQISALNRYAHARGIQLMPEIDVPGHCVSFQEGYPDLFGTGGIICQHPQSIEAMQALFHELCAMFPASRCIHIGGDEAQIENWLKCPRCREYACAIGIDPAAEDQKLAAERLYAHFIGKMAEAVFAEGKIPVAWEGFAAQVNDFVSKDILMMSWENYYQVTPSLLEAGFQIINCSWNPMYIVTPEPAWTPQEIYQWTIYQWIPVHGGSPYLGTGITIEPSPQVRGGQLLAWGDRIAGAYPTAKEGVAAEARLLLERLPYLAENTWNIEKRVPFETIAKTSARINEKIEKIAAETAVKIDSGVESR